MANDELRLDKDQMAQIVQMFRAQSESMSEMLSDLKNNYEPLNGGDFEGDAAVAFFDDFEGSLVPAINRLTEALNNGSQGASETLQTLCDAEEEARDALQSSWIFG